MLHSVRTDESADPGSRMDIWGGVSLGVENVSLGVENVQFEVKNHLTCTPICPI